ncbi:hypothetical protein K1T71_003025 [Dendrolimus kikuchii]|uniref:Uncharacterized protein n=1 Tax=Dendrolimus kikuchii TaxID=765133 RepID=A0ACC1DAS0_9NEOP|nr:hypothetical protein K1T71_003025 [Dendrolimus kikuchii]
MDETKKNVCRACLKFESGDGKCLSLFEIYKDNLIVEKINSFVSFTIQKDDGLPDRICPDCLLELENALQFREKCEKSNKLLHSDSFKQEKRYVDIKEETEECLDEPEELLWPKEELQAEECCLISMKEPIRKSRAIDIKFICNDCEGGFKSKCKLKVHWRKVHLPKLLLCETCKRQFKSFKAFNKHKINGRKVCSITAEMHIEGTGKSRVFHCKLCQYHTNHFKNLKAHLVTHSGARPYVCNICSKGYSQMGSLQAHRETTHKEYRVELTCQYCGKLIKGRSRLYKHMKSHQDIKFQCENCNKMFKSRETLKVHMQRHSGFKRYTCELCAANYYTVAGLCTHKKTHHSTFVTNTCEICGYESKTYSGIYKHKKKHTATNMCCKLCGKFFKSEEEFNEHKKFHYGKKYSCPSCERTYNCKKSLKKHLINVHTPAIMTKLNIVKQRIVVKKEFALEN